MPTHGRNSGAVGSSAGGGDEVRRVVGGPLLAISQIDRKHVSASGHQRSLATTPRNKPDYHVEDEPPVPWPLVCAPLRLLIGDDLELGEPAWTEAS
jgi:hypothetical protein